MAEKCCQLKQESVGRNVEGTEQVSYKLMISFYGISFSFCSLNFLLGSDHQK